MLQEEFDPRILDTRKSRCATLLVSLEVLQRGWNLLFRLLVCIHHPLGCQRIAVVMGDQQLNPVLENACRNRHRLAREP